MVNALKPTLSKGERGSGKICLNGAAARKVQPDDIVYNHVLCIDGF